MYLYLDITTCNFNNGDEKRGSYTQKIRLGKQGSSIDVDLHKFAACVMFAIYRHILCENYQII